MVFWSVLGGKGKTVSFLADPRFRQIALPSIELSSFNFRCVT